MFIEDNRWIPRTLITDRAPEEIGGNWLATKKKYQINQRWTEPYSYWQNRAEDTVREIKKGIKRHTRRKGSPKRLWCFLGKYVAAVRRLTAHEYAGLDGMVPEARYNGGMADISEYCQFNWYDYVWYMDPKQEKCLGRWIGVARDVGGPMTFWVLPKSGIPIPRSSVTALSTEEMNVDETKVLMKALDDGISARLGDHLQDDDLLPEIGDAYRLEDFPWDKVDQAPEPNEPEAARPEADNMDDPEVFDKYIGAEIKLNRGAEVMQGKVKARSQDQMGNPIG